MKNTIKKRVAPFTQVSNQLLNDPNLTLQAIGLYCYMYGKPDDWIFTTRGMSKQLKNGRDAIMSALNELKVAGWIHYQKNPDGSGVYYIEYEPIFKEQKPKSENPTKAQDPKSGKPTVGKPDRISNKDSFSNKEQTNNKETLFYFFESLYKEKCNSEINTHGQYNRTFHLNALQIIIDQKGDKARDFIRECFALDSRYLREKLTPALMVKNLDEFNLALSKTSSAPYVPKVYSFEELVESEAMVDKYKEIKHPTINPAFVTIEDYVRKDTNFTAILNSKYTP